MNSKTRKTSVRASQETILLVDDDPSLREMVGRVLAEEGYLVLCAANGAEALDIATGNRIDLVLLDLSMPGKGGWDTFAELTSRNPFVAVIIITARPNQFFTSLAAGVGALLEKPLDFPTLLRTVRALLTESAEARLARLVGHDSAFHYQPSTGKERRG
ncbi:MAG: response regulator [Verrucomicrobiia bacterium]